MKHTDPTLPMPLFVKTDEQMPWPTGEKCFHVLSREGLSICRNTEFFTSCVPAAASPKWLAEQPTFLRVRYPILPRAMFELIVGFFSRIADDHESEAGIFLAWDGKRKRYHLIVPQQVATVSQSSTGRRYPIGLHYKIDPAALPPHWMVIGSAHSHVDESPHSSGIDIDDERHRAGLHIIVGHIRSDPPDVRITAVVDGTRFRINPELVLGGYQRRRMGVPREWIERVSVEIYKPKSTSWSSSASGYGGNGDSGDYYSSDDRWRNG